MTSAPRPQPRNCRGTKLRMQRLLLASSLLPLFLESAGRPAIRQYRLAYASLLHLRANPAVPRVIMAAAHLGVLLPQRRQVVSQVARRARILEQLLEALRNERCVVRRDRPIAAGSARLGCAGNAVEARRVETEDLALARFGDRRVSPALLQLLGDLEAPERLDLPLRTAVPDGVGAEHDALVAHELQELADDVRPDGRERDDGLSERRADFAVDVAVGRRTH